MQRENNMSKFDIEKNLNDLNLDLRYNRSDKLELEYHRFSEMVRNNRKDIEKRLLEDKSSLSAWVREFKRYKEENGNSTPASSSPKIK